MLAFLPAWMLNIWVRRAALVLALVAAYFIWQQHERGIGKQQGSANESQSNATVQAKQVDSDRTTTITQITLLTQQISSLQKQVETQQTIVLSLIQQRQNAAQGVSGMTATQVDARINEALGRAQNATDYSPDDKRRIAACLTDLPLCNQQVKAQADEIDGLNATVTKSQQQYDSLAGYTTRLEGNYTALWNDKSQAKRSVKCLWLWKCARPKILTPNPTELLRKP